MMISLKNIKFLFVFSAMIFAAQSSLAAANSCRKPTKKLASPALQKPTPSLKSKEVRKATEAILKDFKRIPTVYDYVHRLGVNKDAVESFFFGRSGEAFEKGKKLEVIADQILEMVAAAKQTSPDLFVQFEKKYADHIGKFLTRNLRLPDARESAEEMGVSVAEINALYGAGKGAYLRLKEYDTATLYKMRNKLVDAFASALKDTQRNPTEAEIAKAAGISVDQYSLLVGKKGIFKDYNHLRDLTFKLRPQAFENYFDNHFYDEAYLENLKTLTVESDNIVVVSLMPGEVVTIGKKKVVRYPEINQTLMKAAQTLAKSVGRNVPILVVPTSKNSPYLDPQIRNYENAHLVPWGIELGPNLAISSIKVLPTQVNPLVGVDRAGARGQQQIFASPKLHVRTMPTYDNASGPHQAPHILFTTGVINNLYYPAKSPQRQRAADIAKEDHRMGLILLEKSVGSDNALDFAHHGFFHVRQIQFDAATGSLIDLNRRYSSTGRVEKTRIKAMVLGDPHIGEQSPEFEKASLKEIAELEPEYLFHGDGYSGNELSHWDKKNYLIMQAKVLAGELDVDNGMMAYVRYLEAQLGASPRTTAVLPVDNHGDWVRRWLSDPKNNDFPAHNPMWSFLQKAYSDHIQKFGDKIPFNPLEYFVVTRIDPELLPRVMFLEAGESFKTRHGGSEFSIHGDKGAGFSAGSMRSYQVGTNGAFFGHTHAVERKNEVLNVGMGAKQGLGYSKGFLSRTVQAMGIETEEGTAQILIFINGEFYAQGPVSAQDKKTFFYPGYPRKTPDKEDQYKELELDSADPSDFLR